MWARHDKAPFYVSPQHHEEHRRAWQILQAVPEGQKNAFLVQVILENAQREELETILSHLTLEQYAEMQDRVAEVSNQLKSGYFFTQAVEKAVCVLTREAAL